MEAANIASQFTAEYCQSVELPLPVTPSTTIAVVPTKNRKRIYIAGPFFSISQRWLVNEIRTILIEFGNEVFSPFHDVEQSENLRQIGKDDIDGLEMSDVVLAICDGLDAGTFFEIGYARAKGKKVVVLAESLSDNDRVMLIGSDCEIANDLSTAVYKASW